MKMHQGPDRIKTNETSLFSFIRTSVIKNNDKNGAKPQLDKQKTELGPDLVKGKKNRTGRLAHYLGCLKTSLEKDPSTSSELLRNLATKDFLKM